MSAARIVFGICILGGFVAGIWITWMILKGENAAIPPSDLIGMSAPYGVVGAMVGTAIGGLIYLLTWLCYGSTPEE